MRTLNLLFALGIAVGMSACGDDDDGGTTGVDSGMVGVDSGGGGVDSGGGGVDSGGGGTDSGMAGTDSGMAGDDAGPMPDTGMMMGSAEAIDFCNRYETACTFGAMRRYGNEAACIEGYDMAAEGCVTCIEMHLGLVEAMPGDADYANMHCPHATTTLPDGQMGPCGAADACG
jgi:hypothetical protein